MLRRLSTLGVFCALLLQGWGGALAAVVCPHAGSPGRADASKRAEAHSCCPAQMSGADAPDTDAAAPHCPLSQTRTNADEPAHAGATEHAATPRHARASHDDDSSHAATTGSEARHASAEEASAEDAAASSSEASARRAAHLCSHCAGRPDRPPTHKLSREPNGAKREGHLSAPRAQAAHVEPPARAFVRHVTPSQHAPPPFGPRRHAVLGVFLI